MLGTVSANARRWPHGCKDTVYTIGLCVGPDDMNLALRGLAHARRAAARSIRSPG